MTPEVALERICNFIDSKAITFNNRSNTFSYHKEEDEITAPGRSKVSTSYCISLLHELGHALQPDSHFNEIRKSKKVLQNIIIEQEYQAWVIGLTLASELSIDTLPNFRKEYIQQWSRYWNDYIQQVSKYSKEELQKISRAYIHT